MMITLLKLGGSLITDKNKKATFRQDVMARVAREIREALNALPDMQLIVGHGSGSFGHFEAKQHNTIVGVHSKNDWIGFTKVATAAAELNYLVAKELHAADVPALRIQPSASAIATDGKITSMNVTNIEQALNHGLVPLVYGDVAFDDVRGGTIISTETVFTYLVAQLPINRILLLGEVDGVYDTEQNVIPEITPDNFHHYESALSGSGGVDVTGGMLTKVEDMLELASHPPYPVIQIINGNKANIIRDALSNLPVVGTIIRQA
jgi:isopentenyl phosphate kinase